MGKSGHQDGVQGSNDANRALDGRSDTCTENWKKVLGVDLQEGYTVHKVDPFIYELFYIKLIWNDHDSLSLTSKVQYVLQCLESTYFIFDIDIKQELKQDFIFDIPQFRYISIIGHNC